MDREVLPMANFGLVDLQIYIVMLWNSPIGLLMIWNHHLLTCVSINFGMCSGATCADLWCTCINQQLWYSERSWSSCAVVSRSCQIICLQTYYCCASILVWSIHTVYTTNESVTIQISCCVSSIRFLAGNCIIPDVSWLVQPNVWIREIPIRSGPNTHTQYTLS